LLITLTFGIPSSLPAITGSCTALHCRRSKELEDQEAEKKRLTSMLEVIRQDVAYLKEVEKAFSTAGKPQHGTASALPSLSMAQLQHGAASAWHSTASAMANH
jgi:hypothetical protein